MNDLLARAALVGYVIVAIICFGPATVQADKEDKARLAECRANALKQGPGWICMPGTPGMVGLVSAAVWPLWLSYTVAYRIEESNERPT